MKNLATATADAAADAAADINIRKNPWFVWNRKAEINWREFFRTDVMEKIWSEFFLEKRL